MPSSDAVATVRDFVAAYGEGVVPAFRDADLHSGSGYDILGGTMAVLCQRAAHRDRDLFRAGCFHTAEGSDLTDLVQRRYGIARILDAYGAGTAAIARPATSGGAGWLYAGTRIRIDVQNAAPLYYAVSEDTYIGASERFGDVPIRATVIGPDGACSLSTAQARIVFDDPIWDESVTVQSVSCAEGTLFEKAAPFRARVRQSRQDARVGYERTIRDAAIKAGAANVVLFESTMGTDVLSEAPDSALSVCYVSDAGYQSAKNLIRAVMVALESVRSIGCPLQVLGMQQTALRADVLLTLWDRTSAVNVPALRAAVQMLLGAYFDGPSEGYLFRLDAMRGDILALTDVVSDAAITMTNKSTGLVVSEPVIVAGKWPNPLTRYALELSDIGVRFA